MSISQEDPNLNLIFDAYDNLEQINAYDPTNTTQRSYYMYCLKRPTTPQPDNVTRAINAYFSPRFFSKSHIVECSDNNLGKVSQDVQGQPFCGRFMNTGYLYQSLMNNNHFALIRYVRTPSVDNHIWYVHSIITFQILPASIYIDALCVNNIKNFRGGMVLMNRIYDLCILLNIQTVELQAVNTDDTTNFYQKIGFRFKQLPRSQAGLVDMINDSVTRDPTQEYLSNLNNKEISKMIHRIMTDIPYDETSQTDQIITAINLKKLLISKRNITRPNKYFDYKIEYPSIPFGRAPFQREYVSDIVSKSHPVSKLIERLGSKSAKSVRKSVGNTLGNTLGKSVGTRYGSIKIGKSFRKSVGPTTVMQTTSI